MPGGAMAEVAPLWKRRILRLPIVMIARTMVADCSGVQPHVRSAADLAIELIRWREACADNSRRLFFRYTPQEILHELDR